MSSRDDAHTAAGEYLTAWANDDWDGFLDASEALRAGIDGLLQTLDENEGDARGMVEELHVEVGHLIQTARGALFLSRKAIEMLLDPPATRFLSRLSVIAALLAESD